MFNLHSHSFIEDVLYGYLAFHALYKAFYPLQGELVFLGSFDDYTPRLWPVRRIFGEKVKKEVALY